MEIRLVNVLQHGGVCGGCVTVPIEHETESMFDLNNESKSVSQKPWAE